MSSSVTPSTLYQSTSDTTVVAKSPEIHVLNVTGNADLVPSFPHDDGRCLSKGFFGNLDSDIRKVDELAVRPNVPTLESLPPDPASLLPTVATECNSGELEGPVGNATV